MSKGQWMKGAYNNFDLIDLIDELKTRMDRPNVESTLHGMIIVGKDYYGLRNELIKYLNEDDER